MAIRSGCYKKYFGRNTDLIKALRRIISMGKFTIYTPEDIGDFTVTLDKLMRFADSL
jgi:hypothetical protein